MVDITPAAEPDSNRLNADDIVGAPITIKITNVSFSSEKKVVIDYEGSNGKPFMPCKTVVKILKYLWGADGDKYIGRYMTLFCDPQVKFGGQVVGGIRVSHMSHIEHEQNIPLIVSRGRKALNKIKPLKVPQEQPKERQGGIAITPDDWNTWTKKMDEAQTLDALKAVTDEIAQVSDSYNQESYDKITAYYKDRLTEINKQPELI